MIRDQVRELAALGPMPSQGDATTEQLELYERLLHSVSAPLSDEEACILVPIFGPDDCYGLAWTLLHLIESAPGWPVYDCLVAGPGEWTECLRSRAEPGHATSK